MITKVVLTYSAISSSCLFSLMAEMVHGNKEVKTYSRELSKFPKSFWRNYLKGRGSFQSVSTDVLALPRIWPRGNLQRLKPAAPAQSTFGHGHNKERICQVTKRQYCKSDWSRRFELILRFRTDRTAADLDARYMNCAAIFLKPAARKSSSPCSSMITWRLSSKSAWMLWRTSYVFLWSRNTY